MNFKDCYKAYLAAVCPDISHRSLKGPARDEALLPLSCVPILAVDNHGYSYPVLVDEGVLYLVGSPSGWNLTILLDHSGGFPDSRIALDYGQGWYCININEVLAAVVAAGLTS